MLEYRIFDDLSQKAVQIPQRNEIKVDVDKDVLKCRLDNCVTPADDRSIPNAVNLKLGGT
ncbi:MAG: hypothetical protein A2040_13945 [Rhodocyclales bacterium GWA2_65_19]|nr:MAG: hypothetical protein A2040_13945 [Rhodocyclales bacterium GWA2_65_19]